MTSGLAIPDSAPASVYDLTAEEKVEARKSVIRIVTHEGGRGRPRPDHGNRARCGWRSRTHNTSTWPYRFFGPDIRVQEWFPGGDIRPWPFPYGFFSERWWESFVTFVLGGLFLVIGFGAARDSLGRRSGEMAGWWILGTGAAVVGVSGLADHIGFGYRGFGLVQVIGLALGAGAALAGVLALAGRSFAGWRRAVAFGAVPALVLVAAAHVGWAASQPSYLVTGTVTVESPVSALPRPDPGEISVLVAEQAGLLDWRAPAFWPADRRTAIERITADVTSVSYPLELAVHYYGDDAIDTQTEAEARHLSYLGSLLANSLQEPRGVVSGSVATVAQRVGPDPVHLAFG